MLVYCLGVGNASQASPGSWVPLMKAFFPLLWWMRLPFLFLGVCCSFKCFLQYWVCCHSFAFRTLLLFLPQFDNSDGHSSLIAVYLHEISLLFYAFWTCSVADERPDCYFAISAFVNELKSLRLPCSFSFPCLCFGHLDYDMFQRDSSPAMPPCGSNCLLCFRIPFFL